MRYIKFFIFCIIIFVALSTTACGVSGFGNNPDPGTSFSALDNDQNKNAPGIISMLLPQPLSETRTENITHIVLHFTSNVAKNPQQPYIIEDIIKTFEEYEVSSHYLISRDGKIYMLVQDNRVAYHAGKGSLENYPQCTDRLNQFSIGIEILAIGTQKEMSSIIDENTYNALPDELIGYTKEQYRALNTLLNYLITRYPDIQNDRNHIIGHDEYAKERKNDPGFLFDWSQIGFVR